jgi:Mannosyltransferase putative
MKKGIVLVANLKSQAYCENLIYSIRGSGCRLPIRLIHFGGDPVNSKYILGEVEFLTFNDFSQEARSFIDNLRTVLTDCPMGFLYRFLAWFSDWDAFIYADNDIVALMNWERLFEFTDDIDLVHADEEYTTQGFFNYLLPNKVEEIYGKGSLNTSITAGHILVKKNQKMIEDMNSAVDWFKLNSEIPIKHDQSLLHIASLIGNWKILNLCKPPFNWLSSWSGDYQNSLDLIHAVQGSEQRKTDSFKIWFSKLSQDDKKRYEQKELLNSNKVFISHLHYSGRGRIGNEAIDELMFSHHTNRARMKSLLKIQISELFYFTLAQDQYKRVKRKFMQLFKK